MDRKHSEQWQSRVSRTVNSAACFSLAYVILTYLMWFVTGLAGRFYKFDSFIYYYGIKFILNSHAWSPARVATVYSAGPVTILLLALLALFLYSKMKKVKSMLNGFLLWIFVVGISIFVSQFVIAAFGIYHFDSLYYQNLAVCFTWLRISPVWVYLLNVLVLGLTLYIGVNCARLFLTFSFSFSKVNNLARRRKYFFETALVPYILGVLLTIVAVFPKEWSAKNVLLLLAGTHIIYIAVIGLILNVGWLSLAYIEISKQELVRYKSFQMPNIFLLILMVISWALIYVTFRGVYLTG